MGLLKKKKIVIMTRNRKLVYLRILACLTDVWAYVLLDIGPKSVAGVF